MEFNSPTKDAASAGAFAAGGPDMAGGAENKQQNQGARAREQQQQAKAVRKQHNVKSTGLQNEEGKPQGSRAHGKRFQMQLRNFSSFCSRIIILVL